MNRSDFEDLDEMAEDLRANLNEYGEVEDDLDDTSEEEFIDNTLQGISPTTQVPSIAIHHTHTTNSINTKDNSWLKRSYLAPNETDKEYELFKLYCINSGGRSLQYISTVSNVTP